MECRFQPFKFGLTNYCVILAVLFIQLSCSVTDPCPENVSYSTVVNMCQSESVDGKNSVVIRANTADNCLCSIEVMNQSTSESITTYIKRLRSPFDINGSCGIEITMEKHNNGKETGNAGTITCITPYEGTLTRKLRQNERIIFHSKVINGQNTNGYCIQFEKGHDSGTIRASCKSTTVLPKDRSSHRLPSTKSTESTSKSTKLYTTTRSTSTISRTPEENTSKSSKADPTTGRTSTKLRTPKANTSTVFMTDTTTQNSNTSMLEPEDPGIVPLAVGISAGVLCVSLIIIAVVCFRRRFRKSHEKLQFESRKVQNSSDNRNDETDYGLQYNVMYVSSDYRQNGTNESNYDAGKQTEQKDAAVPKECDETKKPEFHLENTNHEYAVVQKKK